MASVPMEAYAYFRHSRDVRHADALNAFVRHLTELSYFLADTDQEEDRIPETLAAMDNGTLTPGPTPILSQTIRQFLRGQAEDLYADVYATHVDATLGHLFFDLVCLPEEGQVSLESESKKFGGDLVHPRWMALVQALYDIWRPLYLFPHYDVGESYNSREEILAGEVKYLHTEYNYFGPELVEQLGRERLLHAPGVRVAELEGGGIFIGQGDTGQAAAYLGLTKSPNF